MNILFLLIPISLVLLSFAIWAFFWAVKNDQFEDLDGPAYSILFDDEEEDKKQAQAEQKTSQAEAAEEPVSTPKDKQV
ncbi:cbb3-type cytochrome oxidase assembly protein CcoS [Marinospirillum sp.]|uniref:cbb3-type cytochrome oxidase assembly protein CcoS n=1 Tax=Marinospirillum sp. TaxID=2183934 RepID=UPI003A872430